MALSERMQMVVDLLPAGYATADIGCDHGYVAIDLINSGKCPHMLAMDVKEGPLERAREHVFQKGLNKQIEIRISDGMKALQPGEVEAVIIAGMGGRLICKILQNSLLLAKQMQAIVLQPQSDLASVRNFLWDEGFSFLKEEMVFEDGKYYPAILVSYPLEKKDVKRLSLKRVEAWFGPLLLKQKNPVLYQYLMKENRKFAEIEERILINGGDNSDVIEHHQLIQDALLYYAEEE